MRVPRRPGQVAPTTGDELSQGSLAAATEAADLRCTLASSVATALARARGSPLLSMVQARFAGSRFRRFGL